MARNVAAIMLAGTGVKGNEFAGVLPDVLTISFQNRVLNVLLHARFHKQNNPCKALRRWTPDPNLHSSRPRLAKTNLYTCFRDRD